MKKSIFSTMPADYPVCLHADCPLATTCLRHMAYSYQLRKETFLRLINPDKCSKAPDCRYYRDASPVVYARGFTGFQKQMFPNQYQTFMAVLIKEFGRNAYFERRRGEKALSPSEQQKVIAALRKAGIAEDMKFEAYEERINWRD